MLEGWVMRSSTAQTHAMFNNGANGFDLVVMRQANGNQMFLRRRSGTMRYAARPAQTPAV